MAGLLQRLNTWFSTTSYEQRQELTSFLGESVVWLVFREEHVVHCAAFSGSSSLLHAFADQDVLHQSRTWQSELVLFVGSGGFASAADQLYPVRVHAAFFDLSHALLKTLRTSPSIGYSDFPPLNGVALCVAPDPFVLHETQSAVWDRCRRSRRLPWRDTRTCTKFRVSLTTRQHKSDAMFHAHQVQCVVRALQATGVMDAAGAIHQPDTDWVRAVLSCFGGESSEFTCTSDAGYSLPMTYNALTLLRAVCACTPCVEHAYYVKDGAFHLFSDLQYTQHNAVQQYAITRADGGAFVVPYLYVVC